jgi:DnaJ-class molecular chaperone
MYVRLIVKIPTDLSPHQISLLRQLQDSMSDTDNMTKRKEHAANGVAAGSGESDCKPTATATTAASTSKMDVEAS